MTFALSRWSLDMVVVISRSDMPTMPFSGVRNSWLMLARNRLLASFAVRAASVARTSAFSSDSRYSGIATSPASRAQPSHGFAPQYGVVRIAVRKVATAKPIARYRKPGP